MAKAKLHAATGAYKAEYDLPASHFEQPVSEAAMYNAVDVYMGNQRQGTHKTKNRSEVSGGGKKPWKQKGTGRARQGSNTAPQWVRGGKAHGPLPHLYKRDINKKVKRRALLSALTMKANESSVYVFEQISLDRPQDQGTGQGPGNRRPHRPAQPDPGVGSRQEPGARGPQHSGRHGPARVGREHLLAHQRQEHHFHGRRHQGPDRSPRRKGEAKPVEAKPAAKAKAPKAAKPAAEAESPRPQSPKPQPSPKPPRLRKRKG